MNRKLIGFAAMMLAVPLYAQADVIADLQASYQKEGAGNFTAAAGEAFWNQTFVDAASGEKRSCATCHTPDLKKSGKHATTGKVVEPMAPAVNPERFTDVDKINKWFLRNCKWTLGRECTAQEKGDVLAWVKSL